MVLPFKESTVAGLWLQGGFLREQEGLCALQKQPREKPLPTALSCKYHGGRISY